MIGVYQGKVGKVLVRELTKNKFGGSSYTGLGMAVLNLHEYVPSEDETMSQRELTLKLDKLNATIRITITCQIIASNAEDVDDTMSVLSASSDISELAASFESDTATPSQGTMSRGISRTIKRDSMIMKDETIPEENDEEDEQQQLEDEKISSQETAVTIESSAKMSEPNITWGLPASEIPTAKEPFTNEPENRPSIKPSNVQESSGLSFVAGTQLLEEKIPITHLQDMKDNRTSNESLDLLLRIETYRQDLEERDKVITTLKQEIKSQEEEHQQQIFQVRAELAVTKELLKREQLGRSALAAGTLKYAIIRHINLPLLYYST